MRQASGFTLVELVLVVIITGILAPALTVFFKPALEGYFDTRRRAELGDMADTALRRMGRELRRAVPNSLIAHDGNCIEFVLAKSGGLYRRAVDISNAGSDPLDSTAADVSFDVLSPLAAAPVQGDFVVIGNQNTADVYAEGSGSTRAEVQEWALLPEPPPGDISRGKGRLTLKSAHPFPPAYDGGRFFVVSQAEQRIAYVCRNTGEAAGNGSGTLVRVVRGFDGSVPGACPTPTASEAPRARRAAACSFDYQPGATEQSGFVSIRLQLLEASERITLVYGAHVSNVP